MKVNELLLLMAARRILLLGPAPTIMATRTPSGATLSAVIGGGFAVGSGGTCTFTSGNLARGGAAVGRHRGRGEFTLFKRFPPLAQLSVGKPPGSRLVAVVTFPAADSFFASWTAAASLIRYKFRPEHPAMTGGACGWVEADTAMAVNAVAPSPAGSGSGTGADWSTNRA